MTLSREHLKQEKSRKRRCAWCSEAPLYQQYHDEEWGVPLFDEAELRELFFLETQQAGLSWWTVLQKREAYRHAFYYFDPEKILTISDTDFEIYLQNPQLIRHRKKLGSIRHNAATYLKFCEVNGSLSEWLWAQVDGVPILNRYALGEVPPVTTPFAEGLSRELKSAGFQFVGPVTVYAFLQAAGIVNDHTADCFKYKEKFEDVE